MFDETHYGLNRWFLGPPRNQPVITVIFARRFSRGKCLLIGLVPAENLTLGMIYDIGEMHRECEHPPIITSDKSGKVCLRLMYRLPDVKPGDYARMFEYAEKFENWARDYFELPTMISPVSGLIEARWRYGAF